MPKRERLVRHIALDPPIYLKSGETLKAKHIIQGGTLVGRVLFAQPSAMVEVEPGATNVTISHNIFECLTRSASSTAIQFNG